MVKEERAGVRRHFLFLIRKNSAVGAAYPDSMSLRRSFDFERIESYKDAAPTALETWRAFALTCRTLTLVF
jgi:hypothetical protein